MKAGQLRHSITIAAASDVQDTFGAVTGTTDFATKVAARVEDLQGRDLYKAQQYVAEVTHRVVMRYLAGVVEKMVVKWNDRTFQIAGVLNPDGKNIEMNLLCVERR